VDLAGVEPVQVEADPDMLEAVVRNLLANAVAHADAVVRVGLRTEDGLAVLTVDDDGPGIPSDRREEVFRRFSRLDTARDRDTGGVGLGLAIVAEAVRAHHGTVRVATSPAGGARFQVRLPLHGEAAEDGLP
jgi:signal transduction histidine kinase